jgi:epoxyqueuosine reductase
MVLPAPEQPHPDLHLPESEPSLAQTAEVKQQALSLGFDIVGIADAKQPLEAVQHLQTWLAQGYQAEMGWMANPKRQNLHEVMPGVQSVICVALNYYAPVAHSSEPEIAKISRYGWGRDYHKVMQQKLKALTSWLLTLGDGVEARYYVDTGPMQDKVWAERAGLGWIAKNSNLITRQYGSWVFLGEVLTNLVLAPDRPHTAHCGTCTRCIEACPTQAIVQPAVVDANRCIAYHTIENRDEQLPEEIAPHLNGWVAGCDICQDVCPWNQRFAQPTQTPEFYPQAWAIAPALADLATIADAEYDQYTTH